MNISEDFDWTSVLPLNSNSEVMASMDNPDAAVVEAVLSKNVELLEEAIKAGGNPKQVVGKEKMSIFAMMHFHEEVANALLKAGVSFKDIKTFTPVFQNDQVEAVQWLLSQKAFKSVDKTTIRGLLSNAMEAAGWECFKWLHQQYPDIPLGKSPNHHSLIPPNDYQTMTVSLGFLKSRPVEALVEALNYPHLFDKKVVASALFGRYAFNMFTHFSLSEIQKFQKLHQEISKQWKNLDVKLNFETSAQFYGSDQRVHLLGLNDDVFSKRNNNYAWLELKNPPKPTSITDTVILSGNPLVKNLCQTEEGQRVLKECLSTPARVTLFMKNASKESTAYVLKHNKLLHDFKDHKNNNIFHYALFFNSMSASFFQEMYVANKDLLFESNASGYTPLHEAPPDLVSKIEKSLLGKTVKQATKGKTFATVTKRKM